MDMFICQEPPNLFYYLSRLRKYIGCEWTTWAYADWLFHHMLRKTAQQSRFDIFHKLFCTSLLVSIKFLEDDHYTNTRYAAVFGVTLMELNAMEEEFLIMVNYDLYNPQLLASLFRYACEQLIVER